MKSTKLTLVLTLLAASSLVFAQDYSFKVLANKGSNEVKSGDDWQPLKTGASLKLTDEVKLADNSYIGLVHKTGKPMELKAAGKYKVSELDSKVGTGSSVLNKYTDFILSSNSAEAKKNRLNATGAVHRATETASIKVMLPENQFAGVYNSVAVVNWDNSKVPGPYIVTIKDIFEEELSKVETPENTFQFDFSDPKFSKDDAFLIEIASKADAKLVSKQHMIKKLAPKEKANITQQLQENMADLQDQTAMNKYLLAAFYEQNNLIIDAISSYEEAIKLAPDVTSFKEAYDEFLLRQGIKK
jgi:hypothetical protein